VPNAPMMYRLWVGTLLLILWLPVLALVAPLVCMGFRTTRRAAVAACLVPLCAAWLGAWSLVPSILSAMLGYDSTWELLFHEFIGVSSAGVLQGLFALLTGGYIGRWVAGKLGGVGSALPKAPVRLSIVLLTAGILFYLSYLPFALVCAEETVSSEHASGPLRVLLIVLESYYPGREALRPMGWWWTGAVHFMAWRLPVVLWFSGLSISVCVIARKSRRLFAKTQQRGE